MIQERTHIELDLEKLDDLKNHLINQFILLGAILGLIIFLISLFPWDDSYLNIDLVIDISIQLFLFGLYYFRDRFSLRTKSNIVLTLIFIAYISDLIENNLVGTGNSLLILIPFVAIFVYSFRTTLLIFVLGLFIYFGIAILFMNGIIEHPTYDANSILITDWINQVTTIAFISVIIFIFVLRYNKSVNRMILKLEHAVGVLADRDDQLEQSLTEKNVMIQEIHHRVKNNLAVVSGLLDLQSQKIENPDLQFILSKSTNRVMSIAKVHEKLYETTDFRNIPFDSYIKELAEIIMASMKKDEKVIDFVFNINVESLGINHGVPLGIIFNELITNSIKYGFHDEVDNIISISLLQENGSIHATYYDNGIGIKDFDATSKKSLGFTLIHSLFDQIDATFNYDTDGHFKLEFSFPIDSDSGPYEKDKVISQ